MKANKFTIRISMVFYDLVLNNDIVTIKRRWNEFLSYLKQNNA